MPSKIDGYGWFVREPEKSAVYRLMEVPADSPTVLDPVVGEPYPLWNGYEYIQAPYVAPDIDPTAALFKPMDTPANPVPTPLEVAKVARQAQVDALVVTVESGRQFNGDETSQNRMARAIAALDIGEYTHWILATNTVEVVGRAELREALRLAGAEMTKIWSAPYL